MLITRRLAIGTAATAGLLRTAHAADGPRRAGGDGYALVPLMWTPAT